MSQPFSFPPPPPPPPKRDNPSTTPSVRGVFRGRGRASANHPRGSVQQFRGPTYQNHSYNQYGRGGAGKYNAEPTGNPKRDHTQAFGHQPPSRPRAPPPVPDFNIDTKSLLLQRPPTTSDKHTQKKGNALGLTPSSRNDQSDSEDDADEEAKLAQVTAVEGLQFEHKGQTLSLSTPEEIAAWVAARRRNFPTRAKAEAAKKDALEKKRIWEEQKKARNEIARQKREAREAERKGREHQLLKEKLIAAQVAKAKSAVANNKEDVASKAKEKAERLRRKAEKAVRDLQKAEEALLFSEQQGGDADQLDPGDDATTSSEHSDSEDTSSSGSSATETDADSEPEETTSKRMAPERVEPSKQPKAQTEGSSAALCKNLLKYGRCKYGKKCRYSHERKSDKHKPSSTTSRRRGLYQIMVEKEKEEQMKQAVRAIIALGDQGLLSKPHKAGSEAAEVSADAVP